MQLFKKFPRFFEKKVDKKASENKKQNIIGGVPVSVSGAPAILLYPYPNCRGRRPRRPATTQKLLCVKRLLIRHLPQTLCLRQMPPSLTREGWGVSLSAESERELFFY